MSTILILTHSKDDCVGMVIEHLSKSDVNFVRFDTNEFQKKVKCTIDLDCSGKVSGIYHFPDKNLAFEDIGVVWNRRVHEPEIETVLDDNPEIKKWMLDESIWGLNISFTLIDAPIVNPFEINERLKFNKMLQMKRAVEIGFDIPLSRITNNLESIKEFWNMTDQEMIFKKIRKGLFCMSDGRTLLVHTSKISKEKFNEENVQRMRFCPMFFQQHIPKKYDVRCVVVGEKVFSFAIHSQNIPDGVVDYRKAAVLGKIDQMKHEWINLGDQIDKKLVSYTKSFGLAFSVIDMIVTPKEELIFLEDNPNGQWAWLEMKTNAPISLAFADYLKSIKKGR